jgi:putative peptidoglycan lipid II flippase
MVVGIFVSRILGLVREGVIAAQFGQGQIASIYKMAFRPADLLYYIVAGGALYSAFIPVFTEYLRTDREEEAWKVFSVVTSVMGMVVLVLILIGEIFTRQLVPLVAWGFNAGELDMMASLTRILLPAQFFFFIGGLTMGTLQARGVFAIPAMGPPIYNLGIIAGGVLLAGPFGIAGLCIGALAGAFAGNFLLQVLYSVRIGIRYRFSLDVKHPGVRKVFALMLPVLLGLSLPQVDVVINSAFATLLNDPGAVAALDNGNRLMQVPLGIFGQAAGIAALPTLSALFAQRNWKEYRETVSFGVRSVFFATIPASVFMIIAAKPIIALILQAGSYGPDDTAQAAIALVYYCIGVFAWGGQAIVARAFYAMQDTVTPIVIGTIMTFLFVPLNWLLMKPLGHGGLALATSVMAIMHMLALSKVLASRVEGIGAWRILSSTLRICAASGLAAIPAAALIWYFGGASIAGPALSVKTAALLQLLPSFAAYLIAYAGLCRLLKVEELTPFASLLRRRFTRGAPTPGD